MSEYKYWNVLGFLLLVISCKFCCGALEDDCWWTNCLSRSPKYVNTSPCYQPGYVEMERRECQHGHEIRCCPNIPRQVEILRDASAAALDSHDFQISPKDDVHKTLKRISDTVFRSLMELIDATRVSIGRYLTVTSRALDLAQLNKLVINLQDTLAVIEKKTMDNYMSIDNNGIAPTTSPTPHVMLPPPSKKEIYPKPDDVKGVPEDRHNHVNVFVPTTSTSTPHFHFVPVPSKRIIYTKPDDVNGLLIADGKPNNNVNSILNLVYNNCTWETDRYCHKRKSTTVARSYETDSGSMLYLCCQPMLGEFNQKYVSPGSDINDLAQLVSCSWTDCSSADVDESQGCKIGTWEKERRNCGYGIQVMCCHSDIECELIGRQQSMDCGLYNENITYLWNLSLFDAQRCCYQRLRPTCTLPKMGVKAVSEDAYKIDDNRVITELEARINYTCSLGYFPTFDGPISARCTRNGWLPNLSSSCHACGLSGKLLESVDFHGEQKILVHQGPSGELVPPAGPARTASISRSVPWHVGIFYPSDKVGYQCGGSLVSNSVVITAAHCLLKVENREVVWISPIATYRVALGTLDQGSYDRQQRGIIKAIPHPDYTGEKDNFANDIAMVYLDKPVELSVKVFPVCIDLDSGSSSYQLGNVGKVAGWGRTENEEFSRELLETNMTLVSRETCRDNTDSSLYVYLTKDKICAGEPLVVGKGTACQGDSGGGYVFQDVPTGRYYLRGIISLGGQECSDDYAFFTNVSYHADFIKQHIGLRF